MMIYRFDHFKSTLTKGLSKLNTDRVRAIEDIMLACHIYDCIPLEAFTDIPENKTDFFIEYLSLLLQKLFPEPKYSEMSCIELERIAKHESFHLGITEFGYFYAIILLFFSLYRRMTFKPFIEVALDSAEAYRDRLHPVAARIKFWSKMRRIFELAFHDEIYTYPPSPQKTFKLLEQITARGFLDLFMIVGHTDPVPKDMGWNDFDIMACLGKEVPEMPGIHPVEVPDRQHLLKNFPLYDSKSLYQFIDNCSSFHIDQWDLPSSRPLEIENISEFIPEKSVYIAYRQVDEKLFCLTLEREQKINIFINNTYDFYGSDVDQAEVEFARVVRILNRLGNLGLPVHQHNLINPLSLQQPIEDIIPPLKELYNLLFREPQKRTDNLGTLHELIEEKKYILVSQGFPIQGVPLVALHNGKSFVAEKKIVSYVPNATWYALTPQKFDGITNALVLSDPTSDLPGALAEGELVAEILKKSDLNVTYLRGEKVTRQSVFDSGKTFDLIHYAGHGNFQLQKSSYLQLADGPLYIDEILKDKWKASFVFLNACRTGERQVHLLEETMSLSSGILACGVKAVVGTLWRIKDDVACNFANEFYNVLLKQKTVGEAYQHAMKSLIGKLNHPAIWSPYILIGNPKLNLFPD